MDIIISNSSSHPIYEQITNQIKNHIINGELKEGELLPSIRGLAKELQISVITTKRAYEELEKEGFIETVKGKGSFVASQNKELIREKRLKRIEENLMKVIEDSKLMGMSIEDLKNILEMLYGEV